MYVDICGLCVFIRFKLFMCLFITKRRPSPPVFSAQVLDQVLDVVQYCTRCAHILWDLHIDDVLIQGGQDQPQLLLLDVFMPPDPTLALEICT